ncbi:MAG: type IV pilus assembly protein PilM [Deltaproteobacteria bacterium]|nr:type IV pilus assembly protein PilM [Deltaproteobacteria bacterium]
MRLASLFRTHEPLIAVDIGLSGVKLIELDTRGSAPELINLGSASLPSEVFHNNLIAKPEIVAEKLSALLEANSISDRRTVTAVPAPAVFTKKVRMPKMTAAELAANIQLEVGNFIPHKIDAVKIDFHVIGDAGKNQLDVLVVAVKDEVVDSYVQALAMAGLEVAVVDVDYFAVQNCFELGYPELKDRIVALIDIGARYSGVNICRGGHSLFTGDVPLGGRVFTEFLVENLGVSFEQAEEMKRQAGKPEHQKVAGLLAQKIESVAVEFNRQLSLFWNASGVEDGLDYIMLSGGSSALPGLQSALQQKTGIECQILNAFRGVECGASFDPEHLADLKAQSAVAVGLGLRQIGDKGAAEYE